MARRWPGPDRDTRPAQLYLIPRLGRIRLVELRGGHITWAYDAMRRDRSKAIVEVEKINDQRRVEAET